jgi:phosphopantothenoylcysteine synthetase/decarboxylase
MHAAVLAADRRRRRDHGAAVADYTPAAGATDGKIEKGGRVTLTLERTPDILAELGARRGDAARRS